MAQLENWVEGGGGAGRCNDVVYPRPHRTRSLFLSRSRYALLRNCALRDYECEIFLRVPDTHVCDCPVLDSYLQQMHAICGVLTKGCAVWRLIDVG